MWLFAILVAVPIIEIALFIQVGGLIGMWPTLAIVVLTALAGTILLRHQGLATVTRLQSSLTEGRNPVDPIAHGALILIAGVLLLTPGFFTDALGLSLMIPPFRTALIKAGAARFAGNVHVVRPGHPQESPRQNPQGETIIDGDFEIVDEQAEPGNSGWTRPDGR